MKNTLTEAITFLFNELPFSKENERLKKELTMAAYQKYEEAIAQGQNPSEAAGNIILNCSDIHMLCSYLHIASPQEAAELQEVQSKKSFIKIFRKLRNRIYVFSLSLVLICGFFFNIFFHFTPKIFLINIAMLIPLFFLVGLTLSGYQKIKLRTLFQERSYRSECRQAAESIYDRYTKKLTNSILMAVAAGLILLFTMVLSIITSKYTLYNVLQKIEFSLTTIQLLCYFLLKNFLCRMTIRDFFQERQTNEYRTELKRICLYSTVYYFCCFLFLFFIKDTTDNLLNYLIALILLYCIAVLSYNLIRRRKLTYKNVVINIKKIVCCTLAAVIFLLYSMMKLDLFLTQPYINTVSAVEHVQSNISYQEDSGIYTITTNTDHFKILQLTDIHLGGSFQSLTQDLSALQACERLIRETEPDFVIVTGDLVFPLGIMSFSLNNSAPITQFASFMRNIGVPWAFTYGNHDTEEIATLNRAEFDSLMKSLSYKTSKNLLYPYVQPDIYGRSNQVIELRSSDGTLIQALFLIDSNDYIAGSSKINEYDYIHDDQVEWYQRMVKSLCEKENRVIPSMIFTHIPLKEYQIANQLYEDGSDEVTYYYGIIGERMTDKICCSNHDSKLFETAVALGSTKAIFCGHDHYNNLSLEYRGIRLTYGYSIDYLAMPGIENDTEQRGATLITIAKDGSFEITPCRLMDLS